MAGYQCIQRHIHQRAEMTYAGYSNGTLSDIRLRGNFENGREAARGESSTITVHDAADPPGFYWAHTNTNVVP